MAQSILYAVDGEPSSLAEVERVAGRTGELFVGDATDGSERVEVSAFNEPARQRQWMSSRSLLDAADLLSAIGDLARTNSQASALREVHAQFRSAAQAYAEQLVADTATVGDLHLPDTSLWPPPPGAWLLSDCGYKGQGLFLAPGVYPRLSEFEAFQHNGVSSRTWSAPVNQTGVVLFEHEFFEGLRFNLLGPSIECLTDAAFDDLASSAIVWQLF